MYFGYTYSTDHIKDLLQNKFHSRSIYTKEKVKVEELEEIKEIVNNQIYEDDEREKDKQIRTVSKLKPRDIKGYIASLKDFAPHWFNIHFPLNARAYSDEENEWLDKIDRIGAAYFKPLLASLFISEEESNKRLELLKKVERFIFITFRLSRIRANFRSSFYYGITHRLYKRETTTDDTIQTLDQDTLSRLNGDKRLKWGFAEYLNWDLDKGGRGFFDWWPLRYFLYEYELELGKQRSQRKIADWPLFIKDSRDKISIEHIYPQTDTEDCWMKPFEKYNNDQKHILKHNLGNLVPLSMAINIELQNYCFDRKKKAGENRNGYSNGSYSELEIADYDEWTSKEIKKRGLKLLNFMEERWDFKFGEEKEKIDLLRLEFMK